MTLPRATSAAAVRGLLLGHRRLESIRAEGKCSISLAQVPEGGLVAVVTPEDLPSEDQDIQAVEVFQTGWVPASRPPEGIEQLWRLPLVAKDFLA